MAGWDPIPGETPIDDVSGLIPKDVRTRSQLNLAEAENIRQAIMRYLAARPSRRQAPFTLSWCYKLHRHMFGKVWRWAGQRRTCELNIGVPADKIDVDLHVLMGDLEFWRQHEEMELLEQAARLHHKAVQIHPFLNGNGRWARMLANIHLKQATNKLILWPEELIGNTSIIRKDYLNAIRAADAGRIEPLIELQRRFVT